MATPSMVQSRGFAVEKSITVSNLFEYSTISVRKAKEREIIEGGPRHFVGRHVRFFKTDSRHRPNVKHLQFWCSKPRENKIFTVLDHIRAGFDQPA